MRLQLLTLSLAALSTAKNRVFSTVGTTQCQACLATVESACDGPVSSPSFNKCFCSASDSSPAWKALSSCLKGGSSGCAPDQYQILSYYGAHCFAHNDGEEEEICVDASQGDDLKLSLADSFCTEFVTPTKGSTPSTASATDKDSSTRPATKAQTVTATETEEPSATKGDSTTAKSTSSAAAGSYAPAETFPAKSSPDTRATVKPSTTASETASTTGTGPSPSNTNAGPFLQPLSVFVHALLVVFVAAVLQ